jgi:hypothetical protein
VQFADQNAIDTLFDSGPGQGNDWSFEGCTATSGSQFDCTYTHEDGVTVFEVDRGPRGYRVTNVSFLSD